MRIDFRVSAPAAVLLLTAPLVALAQTSAPDVIHAASRVTASAPVSTVLVSVVARGAVDQYTLAAAMRAAGVENITVYRARRIADLRPVTIRGRLTNLTRARLDAVSDAARTYAASHQATTTSVDATFYGLAADCPPVERRARESALAAARQRADEVAAERGVRLGDAIETHQTGGCPRPGSLGGVAAFDPDTLSMRVTVTETASFRVAT